MSLYNKCFLIAVAVEYDSHIGVFSSIRRAPSESEAIAQIKHTIATEYAPNPAFDVENDMQILSITEIDSLYMDAFIENIP